jgi:DNA repair protein RAD16
LEDGVQARCGHWFCRGCIQDYVASIKENTTDGDMRAVLCPDCSSLLEISLTTIECDVQCIVPAGKMVIAGHRKKSILNRVDLGAFQSSTKMEALMEVRLCFVQVFGFFLNRCL